jgi:hypothetical protein
MKYRKKPVVIEARQLIEGQDNDALAAWCGADDWGYEWEKLFMAIDTLEGVMTAHEGDWIIKGVQGEFYPCRNDIFEATYEPADGD